MPKSIIIKKNGGPEVLEIQDVDIKSPGPDEIKVKNYAIGLNYIDTYHRSGLYPLPLPSGIGLEAAGKIEEVGSNVSEFNKGDNIAYASMPIGAYSQQRIIPAKIAVKKDTIRLVSSSKPLESNEEQSVFALAFSTLADFPSHAIL